MLYAAKYVAMGVLGLKWPLVPGGNDPPIRIRRVLATSLRSDGPQVPLLARKAEQKSLEALGHGSVPITLGLSNIDTGDRARSGDE